MLRIPLFALAMLLIPATPALAENGGGWSDSVSFLIPLAAMAAIFYFLIIRPQNRRMADHRTMVAGLKRGDTIITAGGLIGKIHRVIDEQECLVELGEGMRVRVMRNTISQVRNS